MKIHRETAPETDASRLRLAGTKAEPILLALLECEHSKAVITMQSLMKRADAMKAVLDLNAVYKAIYSLSDLELVEPRPSASLNQAMDRLAQAHASAIAITDGPREGSARKGGLDYVLTDKGRTVAEFLRAQRDAFEVVDGGTLGLFWQETVWRKIRHTFYRAVLRAPTVG